MSSRSFDDGCGLSVLFQGWQESEENKTAGFDVLHVDVLHVDGLHVDEGEVG